MAADFLHKLHSMSLFQLSCQSSSSELINRERFRRYFQLLSDESNQANSLYAIIKEFNWRYVAFIVQDENLFTVVSVFTSRSARSARTAGTKIALRFPRLFVGLFVCLFVRPHLSRAQYITSYVTMQLQCIAAFGGLRAKLQQMKVVLCCLDGENVVGSRKDPVLVTYSY